MFKLRHTLGVTALLLASTSVFAAPITPPPAGSPLPAGQNAGLVADSDEIRAWFHFADAGYGSSIFFYIEDPDGTIAWQSEDFFARNGGSQSDHAQSSAAGYLVYESGKLDVEGNTILGSIVGKKVGFGLNVYTGGTVTGTPSYTLYSNEAYNTGSAAGDSGPKAYIVAWNPGDLIGPGHSLPPTITMALFVGYEDKLDGDSPDFDYNDHQFVFSGIRTEVVPEPSTWAMMITGVAGLGLGVWRRRRAVAPVSE